MLTITISREENMSNYLFVHFRESTSPEGEQVYFGISRDGFHWEQVNEGKPILWAYYGDKGVRDMTIARDQTGKIHIFATDLSLSYGMRGKYNHSWEEIGRHGSKALAHWESGDLVNWSEEELITLGDEEFGCLWAPDIIFDEKKQDYILHWSSSIAGNNYGSKAIFFSRTADFRSFTKPRELYRKQDSGVIDSAMYEENGKYYMFLKSESNPANIILVKGESPAGPFTRVENFDRAMEKIEAGLYEAPTAMRLCDGRWCLFLDYYGAPGKAQGYVPFVAESLEKADFVRSDRDFSFPYGFKHGTILPITEDEFERIRNHDWSMVKDMR